MTIDFSLENKKNNFKRYSHVESYLLFDNCFELQPIVSIMIPTFKRPHLIKDAIDSAFNQKTDIEFEVVIVDNDADAEFERELLELINSYSDKNIRYYRNKKNIGMFGNWNRCIELARSRWISILNDDDVLNVNWLESVYSEISKESLIITGYKKVNTSEEIINYNNKYNSECELKIEKIKASHQFLSHQTNGTLGVLMEKDKALFIGGFDEDLFPTADYHFSFLYWHHFGTYRISNELALFRWAENESLKPSVMRGFIINDYEMWSKYGGELYNHSRIKKNIIKMASYILTVKKCTILNKIDGNFNLSLELNRMNLFSTNLSNFIIGLIPHRVVFIFLCLLNI